MLLYVVVEEYNEKKGEGQGEGGWRKLSVFCV
jgi:hypothetical protein